MKALKSTTICFMTVFLCAAASLSESDEICFTWLNAKVAKEKLPQKIIFNLGGSFATYRTKNTTDPLARGMYRVTTKWKDSEGSVWHEIKMQYLPEGETYILARVSKDGGNLDSMSQPDKYSGKIRIDESGYSHYLRASAD